MTKSIFDLSELSSLKGSTKGTKVSKDSGPKLTTARTMNKFFLTGSASRLMDLSTGEYVNILVKKGATDINAKYFIGKTDSSKGSKVAASNKATGVGKNLNFSLAGRWSQMVQFDVEAVEVSKDFLLEKGTMNEYPSKGRDGKPTTTELATRNVEFKLEQCYLDETTPIENIEIDGITYTNLFALVDGKVIEIEGDDTSDDQGEEEAVEAEEEI